MGRKMRAVLAVAAAGWALAGCTTVVVGGAAAIVADEVIEHRTGDDGLF